MQLVLYATLFLRVSAVQRHGDVNPGSVSLWAKHGTAEMLPSVSPLLNAPQDTFKAIETKVASLENMLASQEREALDEIRGRKAAYEGRLLSQRAANRAVFAMNTVIEGKIKTTESAVQGLRKDAAQILKENKELSKTLEILARNISIAQEFALESLDVSKKRLQAAPELQVLSDLQAKDADNERKKRLDNFAVGVSRAHLSMLNIVDAGPDADELIARLGSHLSEASAEKNASLAKLTESFEQLWKEGESHHEELIKEQLQLNATLHSTEIMRDNVDAAIDHLTATKSQLAERVNALRNFGQTLGSGAKSLNMVKLVKKVVTASKLAAIRYQVQANGADGCPDGLEIKTLAECEQAVAALALSMQPVWKRHHQNIPQWCSYKQNGACEKTHCMHFNAGGAGKGRKDLAPICRSS